MQFVRKEAGRYYLHPLDRVYALARVPRGEIDDRENMDEAPPFTQIAMADRGADYFKEFWRRFAPPRLGSICPVNGNSNLNDMEILTSFPLDAASPPSGE